MSEPIDIEAMLKRTYDSRDRERACLLDVARAAERMLDALTHGRGRTFLDGMTVTHGREYNQAAIGLANALDYLSEEYPDALKEAVSHE